MKRMLRIVAIRYEQKKSIFDSLFVYTDVVFHMLSLHPAINLIPFLSFVFIQVRIPMFDPLIQSSITL